MKDKKSILLVEDEVSLSMIIKDALEEEGYRVITAGNGLQGIDCFYKYAPDLIIADVMMPEIDGFEMIRRIRKENKEVPVLFLSARSSTDDIVSGFELGANDYVRKPFSLRELVVRAKALLVKNKQEEERAGFYEIGLYTFYPKTQTLLIAGESNKLSYKESEILKRLCENENQPIYSKDILLNLWGDDSFYNARSLHVFITKLRHKLDKDPRIKILNVRGIGYKLICELL
ncbi:response regulator transcription factor [Parabacteroides hominis]|uniref:Response regulator transcription factor n=1 Tax=Parabacteroides hominis TaxID=2763057 RepID=A0ABR7DKK1_9BACT|nr:response regulator transcription factor [Parabacteroides hominis]MBC5631950.1 response regulator transcription factor [Parabacteroides hominis]